MSVLILVLSARRVPWGDLMDAQRSTWDSVPHPRAQTLYYCGWHGDNELKAPNIRYSAMEDSLENISPRTIEAFEWALEMDDWEFLARPNSSCYVHKANLVRFTDTLPKENVIRGMWTGGADDQGFLWGGGQYIMSRDVIERMVANKGGWRADLMDDEAITRCAQGIGINLQQGPCACSIGVHEDGSYTALTYGFGEGFTSKDYADLKRLDGHFFFRVKQDHSRRLDEMLMRELHKHLPQ